MRDAGVQVRSPLRISEVRLRRRPLSHASEQLRVESAARQAPDISHLIGFGILLIAALLIAIGSMGATRVRRRKPGRGRDGPSQLSIRTATGDSRGCGGNGLSPFGTPHPAAAGSPRGMAASRAANACASDLPPVFTVALALA